MTGVSVRSVLEALRGMIVDEAHVAPRNMARVTAIAHEGFTAEWETWAGKVRIDVYVFRRYGAAPMLRLNVGWSGSVTGSTSELQEWVHLLQEIHALAVLCEEYIDALPALSEEG